MDDIAQSRTGDFMESFILLFIVVFVQFISVAVLF